MVSANRTGPMNTSGVSASTMNSMAGGRLSGRAAMVTSASRACSLWMASAASPVCRVMPTPGWFSRKAARMRGRRLCAAVTEQ